MKPKWTSQAVIDALRVAYGVAGSNLVTDEWGLLTEVPLRTPRPGQTGTTYWAQNQRTIDVMLVRSWSGKPGHRRIAFEVKVSRSDYRNETDLKRAPAEASAHQCYYLTPAGLIKAEELPFGWGLMEVYADQRSYDAAKGWAVGADTGALVKARVRPVERTPRPDMDYLVSAFARRASRAEERIRRGEDDAAMVPALRTEVESLHGKLLRRDEALARTKDRLSAALSQMLAVEGGHTCADCAQPVTYILAKSCWAHTDPAAESRCHDARTETDRLAREAQFGARYQWGFAGPVEPKVMRDARGDTTVSP